MSAEIYKSAEAILGTVHRFVLARSPEVSRWGTFCEIPILTCPNGRIDISVVKFTFTDQGELLDPVAEKCFNEAEKSERAITWGQAIDDGIDFQPDSRERVFEFIDALYAKAVSLHPDTIGGPVDVGFINRDGATTWLKTKDLDEIRS